MPSTEFSPLFSGQITCYGWRNSVIKIHPWGGTGLGTFGWAFPSTVATMFSLVGMGLARAGSSRVNRQTGCALSLYISVIFL